LKFKDKNIEKAFLKKGFVVLEIFNQQDLTDLKDIYIANSKDYLVKKGDTHSTCDTLNFDLIRQLNLQIACIIKPKLNDIFESYEYLLSSFLTKEPGIKNVTSYHQDPTMIEEDKYISAGLWTPLQNTDKSNGCLRLVEGSHRLTEILSVTPDFPSIFKSFINKLQYFDEEIKLKAGQGVLFNNKLIHGAYGNSSQDKRIAVVTALKSKEGRWVFYHKEKEEIGKYAMRSDLYESHIHGKKPKGELLESFNYTFQEVSYAFFLKFMFLNNPIKTIKNFFKIRTL
jgi:ectoine hydroxylase-related dioxygenase (phytanoyl-CoA dioxygenase family)